ncbi:MAG TPA: M28 family peptidase [Segetibacter sp.]
MKILLLVFAFVPSLLFAQSRKQKKAMEAQKKADQQVISNLKNHVQYLVSNSNGEASKGDEAALSYITNQFKLVGLQPKGNNGYVQQFKMDMGKQIDPATFLKVNGTMLEINKEYVPIAYSATKKVTGMPAMALREKGVPWFADVKEWVEEKAQKPGFNIYDTVQKEVAKVAGKGATALFLYNSSNVTDSLYFNKKDKTSPLPIPVVYITGEGYKKHFRDQEQILDIELNVAFKEIQRDGKNVIGYIDNKAASAIIIGASYDKDLTANNAMSGSAGISNAGNNATRAAILIELARMLVSSPAKNNNYVFIAFSGEDQESQGSKYWLQNSTITAATNYVINLDNVDVTNEDKKLFVAGDIKSSKLAGTIAAFSGEDLLVGIDSSKTISGTFHSFYQKNIPVLNVYTATGKERVSHDKINYEGELRITKLINRLIETTDGQKKLTFYRERKSEVLAGASESGLVGLAGSAPITPFKK